MPGTEQETRYREIRRLGAGGMAKVTLADDTVLGRQVALKRVYASGDPHGILRLKREALVGASLNHPNLVFVYDAHLQEDGDVVIVMEYVEGETLADLISARGALPPDEAMRVLRGVATALDAIHQQGIVHRDVKPANVLLGRDGAVKLADLGVADVADRTHITSSGAVVGSFSYMAAEQLEGAAPSRAMDVYALAAVAFEMLTGQKARPESNPLALAHAISTQPPPDLRAAWPAAPAEAAAVLRAGNVGRSRDAARVGGGAGAPARVGVCSRTRDRGRAGSGRPATPADRPPPAPAPPPRADRATPHRPTATADRPPATADEARHRGANANAARHGASAPRPRCAGRRGPRCRHSHQRRRRQEAGRNGHDHRAPKLSPTFQPRSDRRRPGRRRLRPPRPPLAPPARRPPPPPLRPPPPPLRPPPRRPPAQRRPAPSSSSTRTPRRTSIPRPGPWPTRTCATSSVATPGFRT